MGLTVVATKERSLVTPLMSTMIDGGNLPHLILLLSKTNNLVQVHITMTAMDRIEVIEVVVTVLNRTTIVVVHTGIAAVGQSVPDNGMNIAEEGMDMTTIITEDPLPDGGMMMIDEEGMMTITIEVEDMMVVEITQLFLKSMWINMPQDIGIIVNNNDIVIN